jgi:tRNA(Arg) A34 adenosine deaminase TadA
MKEALNQTVRRRCFVRSHPFSSFADFVLAMSSPASPETFLHEAIEMAVQNVTAGQGGPFAALIVRDGEIVGRGTNVVTTINDPTAHAEVTAIRRACDAQDDFELTGCTMYTTCEPCPMCLGAAYWARLDRIYYAATREDAAAAGFDDDHIYEELSKPPADRRLPMTKALPNQAQRPFEAWADAEDRVPY